MKRIYIVTVDTDIHAVSANKDDAVKAFKQWLKAEGIEFDVFKYDTRITAFGDICRIIYHYIDTDCVPHVIKVYTEELEGID